MLEIIYLGAFGPELNKFSSKFSMQGLWPLTLLEIFKYCVWDNQLYLVQCSGPSAPRILKSMLQIIYLGAFCPELNNFSSKFCTRGLRLLTLLENFKYCIWDIQLYLVQCSGPSAPCILKSMLQIIYLRAFCPDLNNFSSKFCTWGLWPLNLLEIFK